MSGPPTTWSTPGGPSGPPCSPSCSGSDPGGSPSRSICSSQAKAFEARRQLRRSHVPRVLYTGVTMQAVRSVDLLLAYDWPYDRPFVHLLGEVFAGKGLELLAISPETLEQAFSDLQSGRVAARAFLARASETDKAFLPLESWATANVPPQLNPGPRRRQVWIKTNLHWEFIAAGIHTPHTLAIPSLKERPVLPESPGPSPLGGAFSIQPD